MIFMCTNISCASFLTFTVLIIIITVTQLVKLLSYFGCRTNVCTLYIFIYNYVHVNSFSCLQ